MRKDAISVARIVSANLAKLSKEYLLCIMTKNYTEKTIKTALKDAFYLMLEDCDFSANEILDMIITVIADIKKDLSKPYNTINAIEKLIKKIDYLRTTSVDHLMLSTDFMGASGNDQLPSIYESGSVTIGSDLNVNNNVLWSTQLDQILEKYTKQTDTSNMIDVSSEEKNNFDIASSAEEIILGDRW